MKNKKKKLSNTAVQQPKSAEEPIKKKEKKKRLKRTATPLWQKAVIVLNILAVSGICYYYLERTLRYKDYFDTIYNSSVYASLSKVLIDKIDLLEDHDGLFENEDGSYSFRNMPENNYLIFDGDVYRILGIDAQGQLSAVMETSVTDVPMFETKPFRESEIFSWLNPVEDQPHSGIFYESIIDYSGILSDTDNHYQTISDLSDISPEKDETEGVHVTMLSVYDYLNAGGQNSFLNNGEGFWLVNQNQNGDYYYVDEDGSLGVQQTKSMILGIRPVIRFNFSLTAISGSGTADDPFIVTSSAVSRIAGASYGSYVSYGGYLFRISEQGSGYTILFMDSLLEIEGETVMIPYGTNNIYSTASGVGKYLNSVFLSTMPEYEQLLQSHDWTFGVYGDFQDYSYLKSYENSVSCYVGLPNQSFMYLNGADDYYLSMAGYQDDNLIYVHKLPSMYSDFVTNAHGLRPVICMKSSVKILSGSGTIGDPYTVLPQTSEETGGEQQ